MDLKTLKTVSKQIDADLDAVFAKYGLKINKRTASVDPITGDVRWNIGTTSTNLKDRDGNETTADRERFKADGHYFGLTPDMLDAEIEFSNGTFKIVGLKGGRGRNIVIIRKGGKDFLAPPEQVRKGFFRKFPSLEQIHSMTP